MMNAVNDFLCNKTAEFVFREQLQNGAKVKITCKLDKLIRDHVNSGVVRAADIFKLVL